MGQISIDELQPFISQNVGVTIYDETWSDQSPFRSEKVEKVELCPSSTHLRIYFNQLHFFAIPLTSQVTLTDSKWMAVDEKSGLHYVIKKE